MDYVKAANEINDLRIPPGNMLEKLKGKRRDTWCIRINKHWRICFKWTEGEDGEDGYADEVGIEDYH